MFETYWQDVMHAGMDVPTDRSLDELTVELVEMLGHPDPRRREDIAYPLLSAWVAKGVYDDVLTGLGHGILDGLRHGLGDDGAVSVFRRSYSALLMTELLVRDLNTDQLPGPTVVGWGDRLTGWYVREQDLRGWVQHGGWAHTVAHGADALAALARSRHLGRPEQTVILDVVADRALTSTRYAWRHSEEDRLAFVVMTLVHRQELGLSVVEPWLARLGDGTRPKPTRGHQVEQWPTPAARNTSALLRALHAQLALGVQGRPDIRGDAHLFGSPPPDRADLLLSVLEQVRGESPWLFRERRSAESTSE